MICYCTLVEAQEVVGRATGFHFMRLLFDTHGRVPPERVWASIGAYDEARFKLWQSRVGGEYPVRIRPVMRQPGVVYYDARLVTEI